MKKTQLFKLGAGAGLATMLLGALLVLAPGGAGAEIATDPPVNTGSGGNVQCSVIGYDGADGKDEPGGATSGSVDQNGLVVSWSWDGSTVTLTVGAGSLPVGAVIVKTGSDDVANSPADSAADNTSHVTRYKTFAPPVSAGSSASIGFSGNGLSNITFCSGVPAQEQCPTGQVATDAMDNDGVLEDGECRVVQEQCPTGQVATDAMDNDGVLEDGECRVVQEQCPNGQVATDAMDNDGILEAGECRVVQEQCPNGQVATDAMDNDGILEAGECTPVGCVTNCGPPPPVTFDACPNLVGDQVAGTDCFPRVVTDVCPEIPGVQQEVDECPVEVLPAVETPPVVTPPGPPAVTPPAPQAKPAAQVLGVQTVRALPRTGDETGTLATAGALMLALGAVMVLGSKRQLARR